MRKRISTFLALIGLVCLAPVSLPGNADQNAACSTRGPLPRTVGAGHGVPSDPLVVERAL
jgi:hypothetical protein